MRYLEPCTIAQLKELVSLEAGGILRWRERPRAMFNGGHSNQLRAWKTWNARFAGKVAGSRSRDQAGRYVLIAIHGQHMKAHRVVFALHHGRWPELDVDHIDGDTLNNDPANLREVDHAANCQNQKHRATNRSGEMGVHYDARRQSYMVSINADGRKRHIGSYPNIEQAQIARQAAARALGYHPNHGRK